MEKLKVGLISLGCDKNRIDSEIILGNIKVKSDIVSDPKEADVIIVNTCGFIEASKQESINTILNMAKYKTKFKCKLLVVTGCLTQRYGKELMDLMPEIDIMLGVNDYDKLNEAIDRCFSGEEKFYSCNYKDSGVNEGERVLTTDSHTAYLRIGEGCNNFCTYCIIPKIRGKYRSRSMENIITEAETLAKSGVKEIVLVAQDTTIYGIDIYDGKKKLPELLHKLSSIEGIQWIRLLYCYPEEITEELVDEISNNDKVCNYLDIPIQHISDNILKRMGRVGRKQQIIDSIEKLREKIDGIVLRTSIIVGFPGETEEDFEELKDFVKSIRFDKLGVFKYSREEGTPAAIMEDQISEDIKERREVELMSIQQEVSKSVNSKKIGKIYNVIIEGKDEEAWYGRNFEMAPEVDGLVYFKDEKEFIIGTMVKIKITHSMEYDLIGVVCDESCK